MSKAVCLLFTWLCFHEVYSAKILGVFIVPSISHQVVFQPIWKELSQRGHEVTVLTPNPLNDRTLVNLTEIDLSFTYKIIRESNLQTSLSKDLPMQVIIKSVYDLFSKIVRAELTHPKVQSIIKDKTRQFDVMLVEFLHPTMYALSARFGCPLIGVTSLGALTTGHDAVGNPSHPVIHPDMLLPFVENHLGFFDRIYSTYYAIWHRYYYHYHVLPAENKIVKKHIGENLPYLGDIEKNVSLLFVNVNPVTQRVRPNVPAVIELGRMHLTKKNPLPRLEVLDDINIPLFLTVQHCCLQLFNTNFGINFALYCISGQNFRKAIRSMLCRRRLRRNGTAAFTVSDSRTQSSASSITRKRRTPMPEGQELTTMHVYN